MAAGSEENSQAKRLLEVLHVHQKAHLPQLSKAPKKTETHLLQMSLIHLHNWHIRSHFLTEHVDILICKEAQGTRSVDSHNSMWQQGSFHHAREVNGVIGKVVQHALKQFVIDPFVTVTKPPVRVAFA